MSERAASYLAIDLGASSGRAVLGTLDGAVMRMRELHRFPTPMLERDGHLFWDIETMWAEIRSGVEIALKAGERLRSISVDSWAVDYVPLDMHGMALRRPYSYRDVRTAGRMELATELAGGADALYELTGIQFLSLNTLPQVLADIRDDASLVRETATRLLIAEYFLYRLSGRKVAEATNASTTQLVEVRTGRWAAKLMEAIGDDELRWPPIVPPGTVLGPLLPELVSNDAEEAPMILATCAHDTAAAVAAVPASTERGWAFISSGTWSLVGVELDAPVVTPTARRAGFTNEAGIDGTVRFLKNRAGMWVLEECRREWEADGERRSHAEVFADATAASSLGITIDLNAPEFATRGDMVTKIAAACRAQGVTLPGARGAIVRLILESLATSHADALAQLETVSGRRIDDVHIVGGGALNDLLNQLTADRCGRRVLAGPEEATVLGNLLVQARTLGDLPAGVSIREAARRSSRIREFTPRHVAPAQGSAAFAH
ncbi:MAG TPA: rhamnulokinase family protein [Gemmatimonadaceae bacterium]|nr:rhamnulokinase family protein [Gemmatimonadaceae bacterium]